jgi:hypothetical protein
MESEATPSLEAADTRASSAGWRQSQVTTTMIRSPHLYGDAQSKMRKSRLCAALLVCVPGSTATVLAECSPPTTLVDFPVGHAIGAKWNGFAGKLA